MTKIATLPSVLRVLFTCTLLAALATSIAIADTDSSFNVDSFIPEKFVDKELVITSGIDVNGENNDQAEGSSSSYYISRDTGSNRSKGNLSLSSRFGSRYETISKWMNFGLGGNVSFRGQHGESYERYLYTSGNYRSTEAQNDGKFKYNVSLSPSISSGLYLKDDVFVSGRLSGSLRYSEIKPYDTLVVSQSAPFTFPQTYRSSVREEGELSSDQRLFVGNVSVGFGWGRSYEGRDASTAMYVIDALRDHGLLEREPSYDNMQHLTQLIYDYSLTHIIDFRLRDIDFNTAVSEYLVDKEIVDSAGSLAFNLINDVWKYFPMSRRRFGLKMGAGIGVRYDNSVSRSSNDLSIESIRTVTYPDETVRADTSLALTHRYVRSRRISSFPYLRAFAEYHKPIDHRWQLDCDAQFVYYFETRELRDGITNTHSVDDGSGNSSSVSSMHRNEYDQSYELFTSCRVEYIPNSRTSAAIKGIVGYGHGKRTRLDYSSRSIQNQQSSELTLPSVDHPFAEICSSIEYRIAVPTTLTISARYIYNFEGLGGTTLNWLRHPYGTSRDEDFRRRYELGVGIKHSIF